MAEEKYRVVLTGYSGDKGEYYIESAFATLFKLKPEQAKKVFQSRPYTLKENLSRTEAERYQEAIKKTGATCEVENMKYNLQGLSIDKGA
jgi:ribosomal protein L7/L12